MARLGDVCIINPKGKSLDDDCDVSFVPMQSVSEDGTVDVTTIRKYGEVKKGFTNFQDGDILFAKITPCMENGKGCIANGLKNGMGFGSTEFHVLRPKSELVTSEWIFYLTSWPEFRKECEKNMTGSAGQKRVPKTFLENYQIDIPSLDEQDRITAQLDKVSDLIAKCRAQLNKLDFLVKARFVEMFGDLVKNERKWMFVHLSELCDVRDGTHDSPEYVNVGYPLLTSKNFTSGKIDFTNCNLISREDFDKINQRSRVDNGDIVMPMIGTIGSPVIVNTERKFAIKNVALIKFGGSQILNTFVKHILDSEYFREAMSSSNRGGTQKFIALGDIRKFPIPVVPIELQKQFSAFVDKTEQAKDKLIQSLDKLKTLKKALMQEYFG